MGNGTTFHGWLRDYSTPVRRLVLSCVSLAALVSIAAPPISTAATALTPASGTCVSCLGKPTNDGTPWFAPLDGFRRVPVSFHDGKRPEIVFITEDGDRNTELMGWPLVKALGQFGTLTTLNAAPQKCYTPLPNGLPDCDLPSFDLAGMVFRSRYVAFSYRSVADLSFHPRMSVLTPTEHRFFDRYVRAKGYHSDNSHALWTTMIDDRTPAISIGNYLGLGTKVMVPGDLEQIQHQGTQETGETSLSFSVVQTALADGDRTGHPDLIHDVNAEANLLTAVICKADGNRPHEACDRGIVKSIAKRLK